MVKMIFLGYVGNFMKRIDEKSLGCSYPIKLSITVALKFDEKKRVRIGDGLTPSYL